MADANENPSGTGLSISWSLLATILAIITVTSLGALVVVGSIKNVDTLSTVALALAILSFAAQVIMSLIQGMHASQISSATQTALAEIRGTSGSLLINQKDEFDRVLQAALAQAVPAAVDDVREAAADAGGQEGDEPLLPYAELEERLTQRFTEALQQAKRAPRALPGPVIRRRTTLAQEANELTPSPEAAAGAVTFFNEATPFEILRFSSYIRSLNSLEDPLELIVRGAQPPSTMRILMDQGLFKTEGISRSLREVRVENFTLTDVGKAAAAIAIPGSAPEWAVEHGFRLPGSESR